MVLLRFGLPTAHNAPTHQLDETKEEQNAPKDPHYAVYSDGLQHEEEDVSSEVSLVDDHRRRCCTGQSCTVAFRTFPRSTL